MSGSPFEPPDESSADTMHRPPPDGVPPIVIRQWEEPIVAVAARRVPFQFSLGTLLLAATGVSVLVSLTAWLGPVFLTVSMMLGGLVAVYVGTFRLDNRVILTGGMLMFVSSTLGIIMMIVADIP